MSNHQQPRSPHTRRALPTPPATEEEEDLFEDDLYDRPADMSESMAFDTVALGDLCDDLVEMDADRSTGVPRTAPGVVNPKMAFPGLSPRSADSSAFKDLVKENEQKRGPSQAQAKKVGLKRPPPPAAAYKLDRKSEAKLKADADNSAIEKALKEAERASAISKSGSQIEDEEEDSGESDYSLSLEISRSSPRGSRSSPSPEPKNGSVGSERGVGVTVAGTRAPRSPRNVESLAKEPVELKKSPRGGGGGTGAGAKQIQPRARTNAGNQGGRSSLSAKLARASVAPSKFRVASGTPVASGEGSDRYATEGSHLAGWVMLQKKDNVWKWRYLEVVEGEVRIFATEPPVNFTLDATSRLGSKIELGASQGEFSLMDEGKEVLRVSASNAVVRKLAMQLFAVKLGDADSMDGLESIMNTVTVLPTDGTEVPAPVVAPSFSESSQELRDKAKELRQTASTPEEFQSILEMERQAEEQEKLEAEAQIPENSAVLTWTENQISLFQKRFKRSFKLNQVQTRSVEHSSETEGQQHFLKVVNGKGELLILTVPDPLVLVQWVQAVSSCDINPSAQGTTDAVGDAVNAFIINEALEAPDLYEARKSRPISLKVGTKLGFDKNDEGPLPRPQEIKAELMRAEHLPEEVPSMKELLQDPVMRTWVYKWSRTQFSSENVKFWVACDNLMAKETDSEKAKGLLRLVEDYISSEGIDSVNIGGVSRKRFIHRVRQAEQTGEGALVALLPGILTNPLAEICRVMEFDILPSFTMLWNEVVSERAAALHASPTDMSAVASPKVSRRIRQVRDILDDSKAMQELLLFTSGRDQYCIVCLTLIQKYKSLSGSDQANMGVFVRRKFLDSSSEHFLGTIVSSKTYKELNGGKSGPAMFEGAESDIVNYVDNNLFKQYLRSTDRKKGVSVTRRLTKKTATLGRHGGKEIQQPADKLKKSVGRAAGKDVFAPAAEKGRKTRGTTAPGTSSYFVCTTKCEFEDGELVKVSDPNLDLTNRKAREWPVESVMRGTEAVVARSNLRPITREEITAYQDLNLPGFTLFNQGGIGAELLVSKAMPRVLANLGVLMLVPGDKLVLHKCFLKTGWVEGIVPSTKKVGLFHYSYLAGVQ